MLALFNWKNTQQKLAMTQKTYQLALVSTPLVGAQTTKLLILHFGNAQAVFEASAEQLLGVPGIGPQITKNLLDGDLLHRAAETIQHMTDKKIRLIFFTEASYPKRLRAYTDSPAALFVQGNADLHTTRIISIIGTRRPTPYGLRICTELIQELVPYSPLIVSGLAYGIDICAHRTALDKGLSTLGVMAHGHSYLYPQSHKAVSQKMLTAGGLISEYPPFVYPEKKYFPMRNRIVAGICDALIVVETGEKGGSIITANLANGYGKDVFAVPGRLGEAKSKGCHLLIKSHRANLYESAKDLEYILGWGKGSQDKRMQQTLFPELSEEEKIVVNLLQEMGTSTVDQLTYIGVVHPSKLMGVLLELECRGIIKVHPGQQYTLASRL